jgi:hypothetical protein
MSSPSAVPVILVPAVQPVAGPATRAEYEALLAAGRLVDLAGRPLRVSRCGHRGGATVGETCPQWTALRDLPRRSRPALRPHRAASTPRPACRFRVTRG